MLDKDLFNRRDPFEVFDVIDTSTNHYPRYFELGYVIHHAQEALKNRSNIELESAVEYLEWMLKKSEQKQRQDMFNTFRANPDQRIIYQSIQNDLLSLFEDFDIKSTPDFPNSTPEDYFAVLALLRTYEAIETHDQLEKYKDAESLPPPYEFCEETSKSAYNTLIGEAFSLIAFIDGMKFERLKKKKSGSKGGIEKSKKYAELNEKVIQLYRNNYSSLSARKGAMIIEAELSDEIDKVLDTDDPAKQIEKWIGRYKKQATI
jgi:hypothetical protein